jgi:hypothetical protein
MTRAPAKERSPSPPRARQPVGATCLARSSARAMRAISAYSRPSASAVEHTRRQRIANARPQRSRPTPARVPLREASWGGRAHALRASRGMCLLPLGLGSTPGRRAPCTLALEDAPRALDPPPQKKPMRKAPQTPHCAHIIEDWSSSACRVGGAGEGSLAASRTAVCAHPSNSESPRTDARRHVSVRSQ